MATVTELPSLREIVAPLIDGSTYADYNCWDLVRYCFAQRGIDFDSTIEANTWRVEEVWWSDDLQPLEEIILPWDILIFHTSGPLADHLGIVVDPLYFVHSRAPGAQTAGGVCLERLQRWRRRCLQVVRLRQRALMPV